MAAAASPGTGRSRSAGTRLVLARRDGGRELDRGRGSARRVTAGRHVHLGVDVGDHAAADDIHQASIDRARRAAAMVRGLAELGGGQLVVGPADGARSGPTPPGVVALRVGTPRMSRHRRLAAVTRAVRGPSEGAVLHVHLRGLDDLTRAAAVAWTTSAPLVLHLHAAAGRPVRSGEVATVAHKLVGGPLERCLLRRASLVVVPNGELGDLAAAEGAAAVTVAPPAVLPLPAPLPGELPRPLPGVEGRRVVAVGPLLPHRRSIDLVTALAGLPVDVQLVLLGDGPDRLAIDRAARRAGVAGRVHVLPTASRRTVVAHLVHAEVVGSAALVGDDADALQTAMALGAPVVATGTAAARAVLTDGLDGRLVAPADAAGLGVALGELLHDPSLARQLAASARRRVTSRTWAVPAAQVLLALDRLGARGRDDLVVVADRHRSGRHR